VKLSHRLNSLQSLIQGQYDHIWDSCCDHGLLGAALLASAPQSTIHFVDIIPSLMLEVEDKLQRFYPQSKGGSNKPRWQVHCMDVSQLVLATDNSRHLIIIAGVGGDLTLKLVQSLCLAHPDKQLDFLLCPVHHHYSLRQGLSALHLGLIDEVLVTENRRFYELLYVSSQAQLPISAVGDKLWQQDLPLSRAYLTKTLSHYKKMRRADKNNPELEAIISAYSQLEPAINTSNHCH
jgi:tRNA (adenine22-N1)-methyltransferase